MLRRYTPIVLAKGQNVGELLHDKQWAHYGSEHRLQAKGGQPTSSADGHPATVLACALLRSLRYITCDQYLL